MCCAVRVCVCVCEPDPILAVVIIILCIYDCCCFSAGRWARNGTSSPSSARILLTDIDMRFFFLSLLASAQQPEDLSPSISLCLCMCVCVCACTRKYSILLDPESSVPLSPFHSRFTREFRVSNDGASLRQMIMQEN